MTTLIRFSLLAGAACAFAAFFPASRAAADTLNWGTSGYTYNSSQLTTPGTVGTTAGGNTVKIQYGFQNLPNGITSYFNQYNGQASPAVGTNTSGTTAYTDGGTNTGTQGTGSKALQIIANFDNGANLIAGAGISVTVFFSKPVSNLMFSFWDVDNGTVQNNGPYNDLISNISALTTGNTTIRPTNLTPGAANTSANGVSSGSFTGSANNPQDNAGGNAGVSFGNNTITQFTFTYGDSLTANTAHSSVQIIALSDLQFTTVPEPSTWACFVAAGGLGVWTLRRRARRQI